MDKSVDLHVASSLDELDKLARSSNIDLPKVPRPMEVAKKLLLEIRKNLNDDELNYIYLYRFMRVYDYLSSTLDKDYISKLLGTDAKNANTKLSSLTQRLTLRYSDKKNKEVQLPPIETPPVVTEQSPTIFNDQPFIACIQLYEILSNSKHNILIMDVRTSEQYKATHLKPPINCINIPEDVIHFGLSANTLGKLVPSEFKEQWDKRDSFDGIVLMDWKTSSYTFTASRLHKLKLILSEWDVNRTYHEKPVILNNGYSEFREMYPTMCVSSDKDIPLMPMDDYVDLTDINYPHYSSKKDDPMVGSFSTSPKHSPQELADLSQDPLSEGESPLQEIDEIISIYDVDKSVGLGIPIDDSTSMSLEELPDLDKPSTTDESTVNVEDLLSAARQAKKPSFIDTKISEIPQEQDTKSDEKPHVDRSTKPCLTDLSLSPRWQCRAPYVGLTGLFNINNTCYMNTVLQCLRHLEPIMDFCFDVNFMQKVYRPIPKMVVHFVELVRILWEYQSRAYRPTTFYINFIQSFNVYGGGQHEDATEFFIHLFSSLNDDCTPIMQSDQKENIIQTSVAVTIPGQNEPRSCFVELFYYKLNIAYGCVRCTSAMQSKTEYENILYLTAPNKPFDLVSSIDFYLHREKFQCKHCQKSYCYQKTFSVYPKIMTIALKRHVQTGVIRGHIPVFGKNNTSCRFAYEIQLDEYIYVLKAIVLHSGAINSGHYTAICKNPYDQKWYLFNDECVSLANMRSPEIGKSAYAFFYCRKG